MNAIKCNDVFCPMHGKLKTRGRTFTGTVVSSKAQKSAVIEWARKRVIPKYERYEKRKTRIQVHNPACMDAKEGDIVDIEECRPLSKTKKFVITKRINKIKTEVQTEKKEKKPSKKPITKKEIKKKK